MPLDWHLRNVKLAQETYVADDQQGRDRADRHQPGVPRVRAKSHRSPAPNEDTLAPRLHGAHLDFRFGQCAERMVDHDRYEVMGDSNALTCASSRNSMATISAAIFLTLRVRAIISTARMHDRQA